MSMVKRCCSGTEGGDRHAGAIECDAVTQGHVVEVSAGRLDGEALAVV
jgi:hypothetical protein